jgi:hypothetical protein
MPGKSIYPSIPNAGTDPETISASLNAMRQTLTMIILNAQMPDPNYSASSSAQVFVTNADLARYGVGTTKGMTGTNAAPAAAMVALAHAPRFKWPPTPEIKVKMIRDDRVRDGAHRRRSQHSRHR